MEMDMDMVRKEQTTATNGNKRRKKLKERTEDVCWASIDVCTPSVVNASLRGTVYCLYQ
jgi:hypothetical protein